MAGFSTASGSKASSAERAARCAAHDVEWNVAGRNPGGAVLDAGTRPDAVGSQREVGPHVSVSALANA